MQPRVENGPSTNGRKANAPVERPAKSPPVRIVGFGEVIIGVFGMGLWVVLFAAGGIIGTQPYRERLTDPGNVVTALKLWFVVLTCYTVTNVAMLCGLSSFLGTLGRRTRIAGNERIDPSGEPLRQYTAALVRGFFVFIAMVAGTMALTGPAAFTNTTPETYLRLAATASLVSFLTGYKPQLFVRLQGRLDDWVVDKPDVAEHAAAVAESGSEAPAHGKTRAMAVVESDK